MSFDTRCEIRDAGYGRKLPARPESSGLDKTDINGYIEEEENHGEHRDTEKNKKRSVAEIPMRYAIGISATIDRPEKDGGNKRYDKNHTLPW